MFTLQKSVLYKQYIPYNSPYSLRSKPSFSGRINVTDLGLMVTKLEDNVLPQSLIIKYKVRIYSTRPSIHFQLMLFHKRGVSK